MLGESPQRDRDIEDLQTMIKNCAAAGSRSNTTCKSWRMRTGRSPDAETHLQHLEAGGSKPKTPLTAPVTLAQTSAWNASPTSLTAYTSGQLVQDSDGPAPRRPQCSLPWLPGSGARVGTVDGMKRFIAIQEGPYHGLNFCQGTVSEMLANPGTDFDVIRYFGARDKIFNVHFRNIRGHRDDFVETYPDDGDVDFVKASRSTRRSATSTCHA